MERLQDILRNRIGRTQPIFKNSEDLLRAALAYFDYVMDTPIISIKPMASGGGIDLVEVPLRKAFTIQGLCVHAGITRMSWYNWRNTKGDQYRPDLAEAIASIEDLMQDDSLTGSQAGIYNANIVSRLLGLIDKSEIKQEIVDKDVTEDMIDSEKSKAFADLLANNSEKSK